MKQFRSVGMKAGAVALVAFASLGIEGTAAAAPLAPMALSSCKMFGIDSNTVASQCDKGSGEQRLIGKCKDRHGKYFSRQGPWVKRGVHSALSCGSTVPNYTSIQHRG